jgi:cation:H+ antiporter
MARPLPVGGARAGGAMTAATIAGMWWLWLQFLLCAVLIACAGVVLSASADGLARMHGWGRGWVGLALLGTITSLPELASGISSVVLVDAPNLAVGHALGACVVNLLFLGVVDALQRRQPLYRHASPTHLLSAAFGAVMLGLAALGLVAGSRVPAVLHLGPFSPLLLGLYLLALRSVQAHERSVAAPPAAAPGPPAPTGDRRRLWWRFGLAAGVVVAAGTWLPEAADRLAAAMGWSRSFVGTVFMAVVTTLPEMAVTLGALRVGALDMAIGNLLGSNLFNVTILAVDDLFYPAAPLLAVADPVHAGTAITAVVMTALVMIGLVMRPQGRVLRVMSWVSVGLLASVLVNAALIALSAT